MGSLLAARILWGALGLAGTPQMACLVGRRGQGSVLH